VLNWFKIMALEALKELVNLVEDVEECRLSEEVVVHVNECILLICIYSLEGMELVTFSSYTHLC